MFMVGIAGNIQKSRLGKHQWEKIKNFGGAVEVLTNKSRDKDMGGGTWTGPPAPSARLKTTPNTPQTVNFKVI